MSSPYNKREQEQQQRTVVDYVNNVNIDLFTANTVHGGVHRDRRYRVHRMVRNNNSNVN